MTAIQIFPGDKTVTPTTDRVAEFYLIQDEDCVFEVSSNEFIPEVGSTCRSPLANCVWELNHLGCPGKINTLFSWNFVRWVLRGGLSNRLTMLKFTMGGQGSWLKKLHKIQAHETLLLMGPIYQAFKSHTMYTYSIWFPDSDVVGLSDNIYHPLQIFIQPHPFKYTYQDIKGPLYPLRLGWSYQTIIYLE